MAEYELWLTDDAGKRLALLNELASFSYTRAVSQLGTCLIGMPFRPFAEKFNPYFRPDWRIEIWRSPAYGVQMRREDVFMLRKPNVYIRQDNVEMLTFNGRNGIDLLNRRSVIQRGGTSWAAKTDFADDMMKEIVREQMLYGSALDEDGVVDNTRAWPQTEFTVQADLGMGPSLTRQFADRKVFDILKELKESTQQLNVDSSSNRKIYFDVVPIAVSGAASTSPLGWEFRTYADLYGTDRTSGIEFSVENENLKTPKYSISHLEEVNSVFIRGNGNGLSQIVSSVEDTDRAILSRWNRIEGVISASNEPDSAGLDDRGRAELYKNKPKEELEAVFLNSPGGEDTPQSLYGVDWDLGDLVRVSFSGKRFNAEIHIVYVSVDENGKEDITGRSEVIQ